MLSKEELEVFCQKYYLLVFKYCMSRLSDKEDAEDATQETFIIFSQKGHLVEPEHVKIWLYATAHYVILREFQRRSKIKKYEADFSEDKAVITNRFETIENDFLDYYAEKYIAEVYSRLNEKEKELFDLCSDNTLKTGQISQILGIDTNACSMRKKRLKDKCRNIMKEILFF